MYAHTKIELLNYMAEFSQFDGTKEIPRFTANDISQKMHISRSLASQYLNDLMKENKLIKINSRPVYFILNEFIEEAYGVILKDNSFESLDELKQLIGDLSANKKILLTICSGTMSEESMWKYDPRNKTEEAWFIWICEAMARVKLVTLISYPLMI